MGVGGASSVPFFLETFMLGKLIEFCDSLAYARAASSQAQLGNHERAKELMMYSAQLRKKDG